MKQGSIDFLTSTGRIYGSAHPAVACAASLLSLCVQRCHTHDGTDVTSRQPPPPERCYATGVRSLTPRPHTPEAHQHDRHPRSPVPSPELPCSLTHPRTHPNPCDLCWRRPTVLPSPLHTFPPCQCDVPEQGNLTRLVPLCVTCNLPFPVDVRDRAGARFVFGLPGEVSAARVWVPAASVLHPAGSRSGCPVNHTPADDAQASSSQCLLAARAPRLLLGLLRAAAGGSTGRLFH